MLAGGSTLFPGFARQSMAGEFDCQGAVGALDPEYARQVLAAGAQDLYSFGFFTEASFGPDDLSSSYTRSLYFVGAPLPGPWRRRTPA